MHDSSSQWASVNSSSIVAQEIDGEVLIINIVSGNYYSLSGVAATVWEALRQPRRIDDLVEIVRQACSAIPDNVDGLLKNFLQDLVNEQLVSRQTADDNDSQYSEPANQQSAATLPPFQTPILEKYTDMQAMLLIDPIHDVAERGWPVTAGQE